MIRSPLDYGDYTHDLDNHRPWDRPKRDRIVGGPRVTSTPEALWWLFTPHKKNGPPSIAFTDGGDWVGGPYWEIGQKPYPCQPIDDEIEKLIVNRRIYEDKTRSINKNRKSRLPTTYAGAKITTIEGLREIESKNGFHPTIRCHYAYVRQELAFAVGVAYDDKLANERARARSDLQIKEIKRALASLKQAEKNIHVVATAIKTSNENNIQPKYTRYDCSRGDHPNNIETSNIIESIQSQIKVLSENIRDKRKDIKIHGKPEDAWWTSFIISCGFIWTNITGIPPNNGHAGFIEFLRAANKSLGGDRVEFIDQVKSVIKRVNGGGKNRGMEPYDRFDSELNGLMPPYFRPGIHNDSFNEFALADSRSIEELVAEVCIHDNWLTIEILKIKMLNLDPAMRIAFILFMRELKVPASDRPAWPVVPGFSFESFFDDE